jgi:hypothetical protein
MPFPLFENSIDREFGLVAKKRMFLIFMVANWILWVISTYILWYVSYPGLYAIHRWLPIVVGVVFIMFHSTVLLGFSLILGTIIWQRDVLFSKRLRKFVLQISLPLTISAPLTLMARKLLNISKEDVQRSFIELNNHLIRVKKFGLSPHQLLIMLPQCMQSSNCNIRIVRDIRNCRQCGNCQIKEIIKICDQYDLRACLATGGTLARKIIMEQNPRAVIAVACERELVDGIRDCYPLPVFGVLNQRPYGPCMDTSATMERLELAVKYFLSKEKPAGLKLRPVEEQKKQTA